MKKDPYRASARFYDSLVEPLNKTIRQIGLKMYPPREGMLVLDVGCGTGTNLDLYQKAGCMVSGIDTSQSMLEEAQKKLGKRAELRLGDASRMPYPDGAFDLVTAMLTLHEMPGSIRTAVMSEIVRVVKEEGRILIVDFHPGPIRFPKGFMYKILIRLFEIAAGREHYRNYRDFLTNGGIPRLITSQRFSTVARKIVSGGNLGLFLLGSGIDETFRTM